MKNLKDESFKTGLTKIRSFMGWRIIVVLIMLVAMFAAAPSHLALAESEGAKGPTYDVTFTKWIAGFPNMVGVVGGAVGSGTFAGKINSISSVGSITKIDATYHMNGSKHSFTAHVYVTEDDSVGKAVITGSVTDGWLEGVSIAGEYTVYGACPMPTPGNTVGSVCFQGNLYLTPSSGD